MESITRRLSRRETLFASAAVAGVASAISAAPALSRVAANDSGSLPVKRIEAVFGTEGSLEEGVLTFDLPRNDFKRTSLAGVHVDADIGFDSEISFQPYQNQALVKWELCVLDAEVNGVLDALLQAHLHPARTNLGALHNHFLRPDPEVKFLHGTALGHPIGTAQALYQALKNNSGQTFQSSPPKDTGLPNKQIAETIGGEFSVRGRVLNVTVDREEKGLELGVPVKPASQNQSVFTFQKAKGGAAVVAEFVLVSEEVEKVASILRMSGFQITAFHNHEIAEEPVFYYMHAFNLGDPLNLASSIHFALEKTGSDLE